MGPGSREQHQACPGSVGLTHVPPAGTDRATLQEMHGTPLPGPPSSGEVTQWGQWSGGRGRGQSGPQSPTGRDCGVRPFIWRWGRTHFNNWNSLHLIFTKHAKEP